MYNKENIVNTTAIVLDSAFDGINSVERLLVIANLLLKESEIYLPDELKKDSELIVSNGKRIGFELMKYENNLGLNLALKAHLIIALVNEKLELTHE